MDIANYVYINPYYFMVNMYISMNKDFFYDNETAKLSIKLLYVYADY